MSGRHDRVEASAHPLRGEAELRALVAACGNAHDALGRLDALGELSTWMRSDGDVEWPVGEPDPGSGERRWRRAGVVASLLERDPSCAAALRGAIAEVLAQGDGVPLFAESGLGTDRGVYHETLTRVFRKVLPSPRDPANLARGIERLFPGREGTRWIAELPAPIFARLARALDLERADLSALAAAHEEALALLAARLQALGLSEELRARRNDRSVRGSAWARLPRATERLLARIAQRDADLEPLPPTASLDGETPLAQAERAWRTDARECREADAEVLARLESTGVSLDLVYTIDLSGRILDRMETLLAPRLAATREDRIQRVQLLLAELAGARQADTSLRRLWKDTSRLLARKVVERAGESGEHYIATTRRGYAGLWGAAVIGGLVTTVTTAAKLAIGAAKLVPFVEGFLAGVNYSLSFLAIQAFGGTLATKQPAMTAAALSGTLLRGRSGAGATELAVHVARIVRSQLAAALGNVIAVGCGAFAFDLAWRALRDRPYLDAQTAEYALHAIDPFTTLTVLYAAQTGVILWLSSVLAGSFANWTVYHRLARGIAEHRIGNLVGRARLERFASAFEHHVSTWAGSVILGFMLAMTPVVGRFFGLPLDVRHVTLSTGQLALGAFALQLHPLDPLVLRGALGVASMFVLNLSVSFGLALTLALRARGAEAREKRSLAAATIVHLRRHPLDFVRPPSDASGR